MPELTASDFDGRNKDLDIPRLDMLTQTITLAGYFSFPAERTLYGHLDLSFPCIFEPS